MTTVRLDSEMETRLDAFSRAENRSKSDIIKEALAEYLGANFVDKTAFELGAEFFGKYQSGVTDNSSEYKSRIKGKLSEKRAH